MNSRLLRRMCRALAPAACAMWCAVANAAAPITEDIRDIRGAKHIASPWLIPLLVAGAVVLALAAYAAWRRYRRRKLLTALQPFEVALQRLDQAGALMHPNSGREFAIEVSNIVREYIEKRFKVMAAHRTTDEFLHDLMGGGDTLLSGHRALLAEFLNQCDLGKFAGWNLSVPDMQALQQSARSFVVETGRSAMAKTSGAPRDAAVTAPLSSGKVVDDSLPST